MGERDNRTVEATGSSPVTSTDMLSVLCLCAGLSILLYWHCETTTTGPDREVLFDVGAVLFILGVIFTLLRVDMGAVILSVFILLAGTSLSALTMWAAYTRSRDFGDAALGFGVAALMIFGATLSAACGVFSHFYR